MWKRVAVGAKDDCWPWLGVRTGGRDGDSYGTYSRSRKEVREKGGRRQVYTHRLAYGLANGVSIETIPHTTIIRHKCDNTRCCNPDHLEAGTQADNVQDMVARGRSRRGPAAPGAILTEDKVREIRKRLAAGDRHQDIADDYGVCRPNISMINSRKIWCWLQ